MIVKIRDWNIRCEYQSQLTRKKLDLGIYVYYSNCSLLAHASVLKEMTKLRDAGLFTFKRLGRLPQRCVKAVTVWIGNELEDVHVSFK